MATNLPSADASFLPAPEPLDPFRRTWASEQLFRENGIAEDGYITTVVRVASPADILVLFVRMFCSARSPSKREEAQPRDTHQQDTQCENNDERIAHHIFD